MSQFGFLRSPLRRPVLALLLVGGVVTVAPARAVPSGEASAYANVTAGLVGDDNPDCDESDGPSGEVNASGALAVAALLGNGEDDAESEAEVCLPGANAEARMRTALAAQLPSGEDPSGLMDLLPSAGLPGLPGVPGLPGLGLPNLPGIPGVPGVPGLGLPNLPGIPALGLPNLPGVPGLGLPNLPGLPGVPGLGLPGLPGVPALGLPGLPGLGLPNLPDVLGLGLLDLPGITGGNAAPSDPTILPASLKGPRTSGRLVADPATTIIPAATEVRSPGAPAGGQTSLAPATRSSLPRTGPAALFQGPAAFALLSASGALRLLAGRRRR